VQAPTSIPTTSLQRSGSVSGVSGKGAPSGSLTPSGYEELVWAQVTTTVDESESAAAARKRNGSRGKRKPSNADSESEDSGIAGAVTLQLRRGQLVLLLDANPKQSLAFCGGRLGRVDRSHVKLSDEASAPQCPRGDTAEDVKLLMATLCNQQFRLVQLLLDCLPNTAASTLATVLMELLKDRSTDSRALLQLLIRHEVKNTSEHQMLFRGNTVASKVLSHFAKLVGAKYLDALLRPLIRSTMMMAHEIVDFLEFSPSALSPRSGGHRSVRSDAAEDDDVDLADFLKQGGAASDDEIRETSSEERTRTEKNEQTAQSVWESTEMVLSVLYESFAKVPPALRHCAYDMRVVTEVKLWTCVIIRHCSDTTVSAQVCRLSSGAGWVLCVAICGAGDCCAVNVCAGLHAGSGAYQRGQEATAAGEQGHAGSGEQRVVQGVLAPRRA
jgi:hypothetical protein